MLCANISIVNINSKLPKISLRTIFATDSIERDAIHFKISKNSTMEIPLIMTRISTKLSLEIENKKLKRAIIQIDVFIHSYVKLLPFLPWTISIQRK